MVNVTSVMMRYSRSMSLINRPEHSSSQARDTGTKLDVSRDMDSVKELLGWVVCLVLKWSFDL